MIPPIAGSTQKRTPISEMRLRLAHYAALKAQAIKFRIQPVHIANVALFVTSEQSAAITGKPSLQMLALQLTEGGESMFESSMERPRATANVLVGTTVE